MGPTQETGPCDEPIEDIDCVLGTWEAWRDNIPVPPTKRKRLSVVFLSFSSLIGCFSSFHVEMGERSWTVGKMKTWNLELVSALKL